MKFRIENFTYKNGTYPLVEVYIKSVNVVDEINATTYHSVSSVYDKDGVQVIDELKWFNQQFTYENGSLFEEAKNSILSIPQS